MATKIIISLELIESMVNRLNNNSATIIELAQEVGYSRRTLTRKISKAGYIYNRVEGKYIKGDVKQNKEDVGMEDEKVKGKAGRPKLEEKLKEEVEKHTYALPKSLVKALRRKAVEEDKTVVEVIRELLTNGVEGKYFKEY